MSDRTRTRIFFAGLVALFAAMFLIGTLSAQNTVTVNPLVVGSTSIQRLGSASGAGSTFRPSGLVDFQRTATDNATINTWNVVTFQIGANALLRDEDTLIWRLALLGANNANTHEYQAYYSLDTATCGGTGAALCNTGCIVLPSVTNTTALASERLEILITRTGAATQDYERSITGSANQAWVAGTCSHALSAATKVVFGSRNTSASAASLAQISTWLFAYPAP